MAYRWFLRLKLTEKVFDASTLSQNRRRGFTDPSVAQAIFDAILEQAMGRLPCRQGDAQRLDSARLSRTDPGDALPQVCSVGMGPTRLQDWGLKEHCNEGVKIAYLARGTLTLTLDGSGTNSRRGRCSWSASGSCTRSAIPMSHPARSYGCDMGVRRPHETWPWPENCVGPIRSWLSDVNAHRRDLQDSQGPADRGRQVVRLTLPYNKLD